MNQKKTLLTIVMALLFAIDIMAQSTMDVAKFTRMDNDLTARVTKPVTDTDEGKLCALIRVITNLKDIEFRADALGIVKQEQHNGEIWIYVPYGARSISFAHEGYFPLLYNYTENIDEGVVYELRLKNYSSAEQATANTNTQMFVLSHNPDDASVFIDGMEVKTENGVFAAMMSKGKHTYKVTADQYEPQEGEIDLQGEVVRRDAKLRALFGTFDLFTLPVQGFNILVNGKQVGTSPYKSGRMEPGKYKVRMEKEKYYPVDTVINIRQAEHQSYTCTLTSFADSLFFNRQLGGRRLSFGVTAGYLMPNVSVSSGGEYAGSAINYGKGSSEENVNFSSASGFTVGLLADYRLYKNLYLMAGVNYNYMKFKNKQSGIFYDDIWYANEAIICKGDYSYDFVEDYTMHSIEIPLQLSYRFVLSKYGSLHINAGGYLNYGLSAKLKLNGTTLGEGDAYERMGDEPSVEPVNSEPLSSPSTRSANIDLYSKVQAFSMNDNPNENVNISNKSPLKRVNYGLKFGVVYELKGFQIGANYNMMLSNMANAEYFEGNRLPILLKTRKSLMKGYKQNINSIEIKLGYILRY